MSFEYETMSEEEAQRARDFPLLPDGIYDFAVTENKFTYSANGNPMIGLKLRIVHQGEEFNVFDNLIGIKSMAWKTKHFCDSTGLDIEYNSGNFNEHYCANKRGKCVIGNVGARPKNDGSGGTYKAKNEVKDYVSPELSNNFSANSFSTKKESPEPVKTEEPFFNDDLPF